VKHLDRAIWVAFVIGAFTLAFLAFTQPRANSEVISSRILKIPSPLANEIPKDSQVDSI
jgi:hypothetical protein